METQKKQNNSSSHSTKYQRHTELRHLDANDIFQLGLILDDNECWKKLMEIIPKKLDAQASSAAGQLNWSKAIELGGRKYNNDHMRLIEQATKRSSDRARLYSQTLIDEWSTSGRKHERPTVGVLLQLLVEAELFRAADYVALEFLGEPPPERPLNGPAARIEISLPSELFSDIKDMVNDSNYYPETEVLNANANSISNSTDTNNKDFYVKYQPTDKDLIINDNVAPPKPPPRQGRSARLSQQLASPQTKLETIEEVSNKNGFYYQKQQMIAALSESSNEQNNSNNSKSTSPILSTGNIPKLSELFITQQSSHNNRDAVTNNIDPSFENKNSRISSNIVESNTQLSEAIIPNLSLLENLTSSKRESHSSSGSSTIVSTANVNSSNVLPVISALNLNGEKDNLSDRMSELDSSSDSDNSNQNDDDAVDDEDAEMPNATNTTIENNDDNEEQDEDNSLPNLSIFGERSSNNDSSLTNVTGTSGENSFELSTNDSSSASNDDNVPCLSALQQ